MRTQRALVRCVYGMSYGPTEKRRTARIPAICNRSEVGSTLVRHESRLRDTCVGISNLESRHGFIEHHGMHIATLPQMNTSFLSSISFCSAQLSTGRQFEITVNIAHCTLSLNEWVTGRVLALRAWEELRSRSLRDLFLE